jgi:hypothetical protein
MLSYLFIIQISTLWEKEIRKPVRVKSPLGLTASEGPEKATKKKIRKTKIPDRWLMATALRFTV